MKPVRIIVPSIGRLRNAGSGLFLSMGGLPSAAIFKTRSTLPQTVLPQVPISTIESRSAVIHLPVTGVAAKAGDAIKANMATASIFTGDLSGWRIWCVVQ